MDTHKVVETELTPALAGLLLANPYEKQRRRSRNDVARYERAIREGRWRLIQNDAILVTAPGPGEKIGKLLNGGHRCEAVVHANKSIPVMICWDADPTTFDLLDGGRKRYPAQFISAAQAEQRTSAARYILWYQRRFEQPPGARAATWDAHEVIAAVEEWEGVMDRMLPLAYSIYQRTSISKPLALAALCLACDAGYEDEVEAFVEGIANPTGDAASPARRLAERYTQQAHRMRRRTAVEDWTMFVRCLNAHIEGKTVDRLQVSVVWPRIGETMVGYRRRSGNVNAATSRLVARHDAQPFAREAVTS